MIELGVRPVTGIVAISTITTEIALVHIVITVARFAATRGIAVLFARFVAAVAGSVGVLAQQFEIGE